MYGSVDVVRAMADTIFLPSPPLPPSFSFSLSEPTIAPYAASVKLYRSCFSSRTSFSLTRNVLLDVWLLRRYGKNGRLLLARASSNVEEAAKSDEVAADVDKEELAAKLAAAEAEAEALRKELAIRKGGKDVDLSKLKPATPEKRIDGIGYRETILTFSDSPSEREQKPDKWGLSEAELFLSKGAPTESTGSKGPTDDAAASDIVRRRLLYGLGLSLVAVGLAFFKIPAGFIKPAKPLFMYLIPVIDLREQLRSIENTDADAKIVMDRLQKVSDSAEILKDTLLSAAACLAEVEADRASSLAYMIFDFLHQVDYSNYYESFGTPSATQRLELLRFSLKAVKAAREKLEEFLSLMPEDALVAAQSQLKLQP